MDKFDAEPDKYTPENPLHERQPAGSATTGFNPKLSEHLQIELPIPDLDRATCVRIDDYLRGELDAWDASAND